MKKYYGLNKTHIAVCAILTISICNASLACTVGVYNNGNAKLTMRTMDWSGNDEASVYGVGRGHEVKYTENGNVYHAKNASLKIKSFAPGIVTEGVNEKGFEGHLLYLGTSDGTKFQSPDKTKPNIDAANLVNYALDNFESVPELIENLKKSVVVIGTDICNIPGHENECIYPPAHYQFADAKGNTVVIEYINGVMKYYTGDGSNVMANDPAFDYHLLQDEQKIEPNATIRSSDRRLRVKNIISDMYKRDVTDPKKALIALQGAGATAFSGSDEVDPYVGRVYPTLWTNYIDRYSKKMILDRHDTLNAEVYNFTMFDNTKPIETKLGAHPFFKN